MNEYLETPVGFIRITFGSDGQLTGIDYQDGKKIKESAITKNAALIKQLKDYFSGRLRVFNIGMDFSGTDFQQAVWREIAKIPFGKTISYGEIARAIGRPNASRAVGAACGLNPISVVVPCHRVVGTSGKLTGYAGGLWRKKWLLDFERNVLASDD